MIDRGSRVAPLAALGAVLVLGACSGGERPERAATTSQTRSAATTLPPVRIDPCALVTSADAQVILGTSGPQPKGGRRVQDNFCSYSVEGGYLGVLVATKRFSKPEFEAGARAAGGASVAGLADAAFWRSKATSLNVLKGSIVLRVDIFTRNTPKAVAFEAAKALARRAVARIPAEQAGSVLAATTDTNAMRVNPCTLVNERAVRELAGEGASAERFSEIGYVGCHWSGPTGFLQATVLTKDYSAEEFAAGANGGRSLSGLGDRAFMRSSDGLADIAVLKGSAVFTLRLAVPGSSESALVDAARTLAVTAIRPI